MLLEFAQVTMSVVLVIGSILVFIGTVGLLERLSWLDWLDWDRLADLWPLVLIAMGVALITRSRSFRLSKGR